MIKDWCPKYTKNYYSSVRRQPRQFLKWAKIWTDTSQKKLSECFISMWKGGSHLESSGKYKLKPQWDTTTYLLECLKVEPNDFKCWWGYETTQLSHTGVGVGAWNIWQFLKKLSMQSAVWPSHPTYRYLPKKNRSTGSLKDSYTKVYGSFFCNVKNLEITQISITRSMD